MEMIKVGIYHDDAAFARALAIGLARESRTILFVLMEKQDTAEELDLVLSSERSEKPEFVQLVHYQEMEHSDSPPYRLYQYKESRSLIDDLLFIYFKMTDRVLEYKGTCRCRLMTLVSDAGGSGTTMTGIAMAKTLNRVYGLQVLYLNLCPVDDSKKYLRSDRTANMLKLLYYLDTGKKFPLESFISRGEEMDYINTDVINAYFNDIKPALMTQFLKKVDELGRYDYLMFDMSSHFSRENRRIMENCDLVVFIHRWHNKEPTAYYEAVSQEVRKNAGGLRFLTIVNFAGDDWPAETCEAMWISEDRKALRLDKKEGVFEIDLSKNYGIEIAAIAKRIVEDI